ncbi:MULTISPECIES: potassium channel family protein [Flavobacteriaceae]|uniref:potassium channel family protein n=1 Tax=Flavobacteriaceae TaxID=49546 RepID=UPI002349F154|nr:potassium channel family protein [Muricauda sp. SP22]MDC6364047.1 potassium channel family protein [Muricauda sp. SP22]
MLSFVLNIYRFAKAIVKGIKNDDEFKFLCYFLMFLLIGSTLFYSQTEHWSVIDSLYFSVMTMATVGYGDFVPTTDLGKVFTIIYAFLSIGTFVAFTAKIVRLILEDGSRRKLFKNSTRK